MKTNNGKKVTKKFDLEKMKVVKLKNMHLIIGGNSPGDIYTTTDTRDLGNRR
jgi:hypothetical protein